MRNKKVLISLGVALVLSLSIAGAAFATTGGSDQAYRGGTAVSTADQTQTQSRLCDGSGPYCDGVCDTTCDGTCDGAGPHGSVATQAGNGNGNGSAVQQRDRTCDETCDRTCDGTCDGTGSQDQQRLRNGGTNR
jgi:hypothetical protein